MDVPAAAAGATATLPPPVPPTPTPAPVTTPTASDTTTQTPSTPATSSNTTNNGTPQVAPQQPSGSIAPVVAKLFNAQAQNVVVSFQVVRALNEVVTVFTDKTTGKEIVQFPSQELIALAEFFNKLAGTVVDKSA